MNIHGQVWDAKNGRWITATQARMAVRRGQQETPPLSFGKSASKAPVARKTPKAAKGKGSVLDLPAFMLSVGKQLAAAVGAKPSDASLSQKNPERVIVSTTEGNYTLRFSVNQSKRDGAVLKVACSFKKWTGRAKPKTCSAKQPFFTGAKLSTSDISSMLISGL